MNAIARYHREAMELAENALVARARQGPEEATRFLQQAFESEAKAARLASGRLAVEPTRSVLYRSAASLALQCGKTREAERLIAAALSGEPPDDIAEELRDLLEQVQFQRHLDLRGVSLAPEEFQLSIAGDDVGFGIASTDSFLERVHVAERMVYRCAERKLNKPFRERGAPSKDVRDLASVYISVPRAASFAVTVRVGGTFPQKVLNAEWDLPPEAIVHDVLDCLESFSMGDTPRLSELIPQEDYRRNFSALARNLAPDGKHVKTVGLTSCCGAKVRSIALTTPAPSQVQRQARGGKELVTVKGRLLFADELRGESGMIQVVDKANKKHPVIVPKGMMSDIVKPLWEDTVVVTGRKRKRGIELESINRAES